MKIKEIQLSRNNVFIIEIIFVGIDDGVYTKDFTFGIYPVWLIDVERRGVIESAEALKSSMLPALFASNAKIEIHKRIINNHPGDSTRKAYTLTDTALQESIARLLQDVESSPVFSDVDGVNAYFEQLFK